MKAISLVLTCILAVGTTGCSTTNPDVISRQHAQRPQTVRSAVVESIRAVTVDGTQSGIGAAAGAVAGAVAGAGIGGHREQIAAGVLLGVGGAVLGNAIERAATRENAVEIVVRLRDGTRQAIVQGRGNQTLAIGDHVELVSEGAKVRVIRAN